MENASKYIKAKGKNVQTESHDDSRVFVDDDFLAFIIMK